MKDSLNRPFMTFSLTGAFSVGKTFITNMLAGTKLLSGETVHTNGISIYENSEMRMMFLDTAGSNNPVKHSAEYILDRRLTDFYIE